MVTFKRRWAVKLTASAVDTTISPGNIFDNQMRACSASDNFVFKNAKLFYITPSYIPGTVGTVVNEFNFT